MRGLNKFIIVAIATIALFAFMGTASAKPYIADGLTVKVDTIQTNGVYLGIPTVNSSTGQVSFEYRLMPDGTYTVMGTVTNDNPTLTYTVDIEAFASIHDKAAIASIIPGASTQVTVPNGTSAKFSLTIRAPSDKDITVRAYVYVDGERNYIGAADMSNTDYVDVGDFTTHTVDQGPMSDATVIFTNGVPTYTGKPVYWISLG